jgi:hypothetical protein
MRRCGAIPPCLSSPVSSNPIWQGDRRVEGSAPAARESRQKNQSQFRPPPPPPAIPTCSSEMRLPNPFHALKGLHTKIPNSGSPSTLSSPLPSKPAKSSKPASHTLSPPTPSPPLSAQGPIRSQSTSQPNRPACRLRRCTDQNVEHRAYIHYSTFTTERAKLVAI